VNKKVVFPLMAIGVLATAGALWLGIGQAKADNNGQTMTEQLSQKLGLDQSKVESAMQEIRTEHQTEAKAARDAKLEQAVQDGVLTEDQKTTLIQKRDQMHEQMQQQRQEMQQWMEDQNIDAQKLHQYEIGGPGGGMHRGGYMGGQDDL